MIEVNCDYCNKIVLKNSSSIKRTKHCFCSSECYHKWVSENKRGKNHARYNKQEVACDYCGKIVLKYPSSIKRAKHHFCSHKCSTDWNSENVRGNNHPRYSKKEVVCDYCGSKFNRSLYFISQNDRNFCNQVCYNKWQKENIPKGKDNPRYNKQLIICDTCGKKFLKHPSEINMFSYCSRECYDSGISSPEFIKAMIKRRHILPTEPEKQLMSILDESFPNKFVYNGDFSAEVVINRKIPDFVDEENKLIIEMFGEYWHGPQEVYLRQEQFKEFGWDTLIIWDYELDDTKKVINQIDNFLLKNIGGERELLTF